MRRKVLVGILLMCLVLGVIPINSAEETQVTNVKNWSENRHYYELIKKDVNWNEAKEYAEKQEFEKNGVVYKGYLANITSQEENSWVVENLVSPTGKGDVYPWLGGYQVQGYNNPSEGWKWVTGEDWSWTNWNEGEPNDLFGRSNERYLKMYPSGKWNDESIDGEPGWENYILIEYQPIEGHRAPLAIRVSPSSSTVSVAHGEKQTFKIKATDEDGDLHMVQWEVNREWIETDSLATLNEPNLEGSADFTYTFEESSTVKAIVYDEHMNSDSITRNVEVTTPTPTPEHITWETETIYSPDEGRIRIVDGPSEDYVYATFLWHEKPDTPRWFDAIDFEVRGNYEVIEPEFPNKNPSAEDYSNLPCKGEVSQAILTAALKYLYDPYIIGDFIRPEIAKKIGGWGIDPGPEVDYPSFGGVLYEEDKTDISIKFDPSEIEEEKEYYVKFPVKIKKSGDITLEFELKDYYHIPVEHEHESLEIPMRKGEEIAIDINGEEQNSPSYEEPKMITSVKEIKSGTFMLGDEEIPYLSVVVENSLSPPGCQNAVGTCIPTTEELEVVMIEKSPPPSFTAVTDYPKRKSYDVDFSIEKPINRIFGGEKSQEAEEAKTALIIDLASLPSGGILSTGEQIVYGLTQSTLLDIANEEDISWKNFLSVILFADTIEKSGLIEIENYYVPTGFERSYIEVYVKTQNGEPVEGAKVSTQICYFRGCDVKIEYTDPEGYCKFSAIPLSEYQPGKKYIITVEKEGYKKQEKNVKTKERVTFYLGEKAEINKPDLSITSLSWSPEKPEEGVVVTFSYTIKNQGTESAEASKTALFIDGKKVCEDDVNSLDSGDYCKETFRCKWKVTAGLHEIRVVADYYGNIEESKEGNNELRKMLLAGEGDITEIIDEFIPWWNENKEELFKAAHEFVDEFFKFIDELISEYKKGK